MKKILIVCTGNTCRSPMAEYIARDIASKKDLDYEFSSAGIAAQADEVISENALAALEEIGIDAAGHIVDPLSKYNIADFDEIHVMSFAHKRAVLNSARSIRNLHNKVIVINTADPYECDIDVYRKCRDSFIKYYESSIL